MEEFLDPARILLGALGFPLLQPLLKPGGSDGRTVGKAGPLAGVKLIFKLPKRDLKRRESRPTRVSWCSRGHAATPRFRTTSIPDGRTAETNCSLTAPLSRIGPRFASRKTSVPQPSAAAAVVCGGNRNGREVWKTESGKMLKPLEEELLAGGTARAPLPEV